MKKFSVLILLISFLLINGFSQTTFKQLSEQQVKTLLCHKWKLTFLEGKGKKVNVPVSSPQLLLGFHMDGTLSESEGKKNYKGTWTYKHDSFTLTTNDQDGIENYNIVNLTANVLVVKTKVKGIDVSLGMQLAD